MLPPLALAAGLLLSAPAAAQDYPARQIGDWTIAASKDRQGCFLTKEYPGSGRTTLLLGLDIDGGNHLSVLNQNWSIKPKDRLTLNFRLSSGGYTDHFAVGIVSDGKQGFVTNFEPRFLSYFASSKALHIDRGDVAVARLALDGSGAAVAELRRCVDVQQTSAKAGPQEAERSDDIPRDPFAKGTGRKPKR
ncbi:hypothetical protein ACG3SL_08485 [Sphingomonas sp. CJ20]